MKRTAKNWRRRLTIAGFVLLLAGALAFFLFPSTSFSPPPGQLGYDHRGERKLFEISLDNDENNHKFPGELESSVQWQEILPGLRRGELHFRREWRPHHFRMVLYEFEPKRFLFHVVPSKEAFGEWTTVEELARKQGALFAINANYFSNQPLGLVIHHGRLVAPHSQVMPGIFYVPRNGRGADIAIDRSIRSLDAMEAMQSFPVLLQNGRIPEYVRTGHTQNGRKLLNVHEIARRSAVSQMSDGCIVFAVTDTFADGLSFLELAAVLQSLGMETAVALDGGGSTQAYLRTATGEEIVKGLDRVPVIITVHTEDSGK